MFALYISNLNLKNYRLSEKVGIFTDESGGNLSNP